MGRNGSILDLARGLIEQGKFAEAIVQCESAFLRHAQEGEYANAVHSFVDKTNAWIHLFNQSKEPAYLYCAMSDIAVGRKLSHEWGAVNEFPHLIFREGTVFLASKDYASAYSRLNEAVSLITDPNNPQMWDWQAHRAIAQFLLGQHKEGKRDLLAAIAKLKHFSETAKGRTERDGYEIWYSGACLKGATVLFNTDPALAEQLFECAKTVIDGNPNLLVRKMELARFKFQL
jgi:hypothetical protein